MNVKELQLKAMEALLTEEDKQELSRIYEPTVVAVPPVDTRCGLCIMPDGELRYYGFRDKASIFDYSHPIYLSSRDCGLSWKTHVTDAPCMASGIMMSNGKYLALSGSLMAETGHWMKTDDLDKGFYALIADAPGDKNYKIVKVSEESFADMYLPQELSSGRIVCTAQTKIDGDLHPVFLFSDDFGETWNTRVLPCCDKFSIVYPHKGLRWQNRSGEPTMIELNDGRLYLLARTSLDVFYEYYSEDGGETWSSPAPSRFHGTLTSPQLLKLHDGRIVIFYNNTQPLPELDHTKQVPALNEGEITGEGGEDFFTNRDANHAAITGDWINWTGFREVALNWIRNDSDYRTEGDVKDSLDKSVHQFQAIELPFGKIMVSYGQNPIARRLVIFDVNWLYETKRSENFRNGLSKVSTQVYVKSVPGNFRVAGHCAYNRTHGALLMPDPEGNFEEALFLSRIRDPRKLSDNQGVVWNFPAAKSGKVIMRLRIDGQPIHVSLCDRWFNPIDEYVPYYAEAHCELAKEQLADGVYSNVEIAWDETTCILSCEGKELYKLPMKGEAVNGISYLILQSPYEGEDEKGCYIKSFEKE